MDYVTSQRLARYYDLYQNIDVTFTKEVINAIDLIPQQVYIKTRDGQWPCVINSASLVGAKVIAGIKSGLYAKINQGNNSVSLRFAFLSQEKKEALTFFVSAKVLGMNQYADSPDLILISIQYTQRAPDDLIERLGSLLEANVNFAKRKEERITINTESMQKLGIIRKECILFVQETPYRCILRDVSFSGAKILMAGDSSFLLNQPSILKIDFDDSRAAIKLLGKIVRAEEIESGKNIVALSIAYEEKTVPMLYKMHINTYLTQQRRIQIQRTPNEDDSQKSETDN
ncbi:PilZ domain-containing protein [Brucepastera parasyntrophica]|uniref:PilZ domain-containing protein n=1 Tax=Brucepastera parasyntrophica TaxID=2880008 RepID=UPI00210E51A1|nr:PilZ domain-containing protein [Brucepastera parasyntrophica]ULQ60645.1 PilZ domain-containing protein [Brucepastera parasyntrophica]